MNNNENNNRFINNVSNVNSTNLDLSNTTSSNEVTSPIATMNVEDAKLKAQVVKEQQNQFINKESIRNETSLNDLNVDGKYNKLDKSPYSDEEKVRDNIDNRQKHNIKITLDHEKKVFLIIVAVMLVFIFIMPFIFDLIENIRFD